MRHQQLSRLGTSKPPNTQVKSVVMAGGWREEAAYSKAERLTRRSNTDCWISREADESRLTTCRTALGCIMNLACTSAVKRNREHEEWRRHALNDSIRTIKEEVEKRSGRSGHDLLRVLHLAQGDRFAFLVLAICGTPQSVSIAPGYDLVGGGLVSQRTFSSVAKSSSDVSSAMKPYRSLATSALFRG